VATRPAADNIIYLDAADNSRKSDFEQALRREVQLARLEYAFWHQVYAASPCPQTQLRCLRALCRFVDAQADVRGGLQ
jgi:hypothetical protein